MIDTGAAVLGWLGTSLVVVSDGRRGLAAGTALATAAIVVLAYGSSGDPATAALALGGVIAAVRRFAVGAPGWQILPPGSTPRLVLCIAAAILALWVADAVGTGPGAQLRFAVMLVIGLCGARVFTTSDPSVLLTATALLALAVGLAADLGATSPGPWPYLAAGLVAGTVTWVPTRTARAA